MVGLPHVKYKVDGQRNLAAHNGLPLRFPLYAVHKVEQPPGPAAQWLLAELRRRFWIAETADDRSELRGIQIRVSRV